MLIVKGQRQQQNQLSLPQSILQCHYSTLRHSRKPNFNLRVLIKTLDVFVDIPVDF